MQNHIEIKVDTSGTRIDTFISQRVPNLSRAAVQRLLDQGQVLVDGQHRKPGYRLRSGENIFVRIPSAQPSVVQPESIPLDIIYEDEDVIVINKPAGMVVHPAVGHSGGTLVNAVLAYAPNVAVGGVERPGIVHRLDRDTSGLIVVAKNDTAMHKLQSQWKSHVVHKEYLALVEGHVEPFQGKIDAPIARDPKNRQHMSVVTIGKKREAITVYHTIADLGRYTLLLCEPATGRTHQVRVHLAFLGHPIVGDQMYNRRKNPFGLDRQFLHAWKMDLTLPGGQPAHFRAPLPSDLVQVLSELNFDAAKLT